MAAGYLVTLHVVMVPEDFAVARVVDRVSVGGHAVPEEKVRQRYQRLWRLVASAIRIVDSAIVYDNSKAAQPLRVVATWTTGRQLRQPEWPTWTPAPIRSARFQ